ncbi:unnamed protein product [marine sediment metagenome]|uniref:Uncharacterized protein n=1 Tax=marine sediment metagenome TaxID=412755 RepID=X1LS18_9ZZZZ
MEKQLDHPFIVISVMLENTTNEMQEDGIGFSMPGSTFYAYDSEDNKFLSAGCLEGNTIFDEIDSLSPGDNKKWPPGVKLTGNICCDVLVIPLTFHLHQNIPLALHLHHNITQVLHLLISPC